MKTKLLILLLVVTILPGCDDIQPGISNDIQTDLPKSDKSVVLYDLSGTYAGYIASFKSGESHFDIGSTLSSLSFEFGEDEIFTEFTVTETGVVDIAGSAYFDSCTKEGDLIEMSVNHDELGVVELKGIITQTTFTGKIRFEWNGEQASMNFISVKGTENEIGNETGK